MGLDPASRLCGLVIRMAWGVCLLAVLVSLGRSLWIGRSPGVFDLAVMSSICAWLLAISERLDKPPKAEVERVSAATPAGNVVSPSFGRRRDCQLRQGIIDTLVH